MDTQLGAPRSSPRAQSELTKPTSSLVSSRQGIKAEWKHLHARHAGGRGVKRKGAVLGKCGSDPT